MRLIEEGGRIEVARGEVFAITRRGLEGAGYRTSVQVPDGVSHVGTPEMSSATAVFGGRPRIAEQFRCERAGEFDVRFVSARPWAEGDHVVVSRVICR